MDDNQDALITRYDRLRFAYANVLKERRRWIARHDNLKQRVEDLEAELAPLKASHEARAKILLGLERDMRESFAIRSDDDDREYKKKNEERK